MLCVDHSPLTVSPQVLLRSLALPKVTLSGDVRRSQTSHLPLVCMELAVQKVNIDLTTDSLNQLLVLQNSFIKVQNTLKALLFILSVCFHRAGDE